MMTNTAAKLFMAKVLWHGGVPFDEAWDLAFGPGRFDKLIVCTKLKDELVGEEVFDGVGIA